MLAWLVVSATLVAPLDFETLMAEVEDARIRGDRQTLERLAGELQGGLSDAEGEEEITLGYALAYARWRLALFDERESEPYEEQLKLAEDLLEDLLEAEPDHAEAQALYGSVNGGLITGMWSGMRRGPRADDAYERARRIAPDNPRVAMHQGVSRLFRPGMFGGGLDEAERELQEALELFAKEPEDAPWPNWGRAEIHGWLGMTLLRKGELARAREHYETALALEPEFHWVRVVLLPELQRAEAAAVVR